MREEFPTLDDLMYSVLTELINCNVNIETSRGLVRGEIIGKTFTLINPRARLSRTETRGRSFSTLGELLWYLSGSNSLEYITHYIPQYNKEINQGETHINGAYGPRLFNMHQKYNQIQNVINKLKTRPSTRKAVIQIYDAEDLENGHKAIPCTCTLQFLIRKNELHMVTFMRSNDAYLGLPHDIFTFTMIQEYIASILGVNLGKYYHSVGNLHVYKKNIIDIKSFLEEGYQPTTMNMPSMPKKNVAESLKQLIIFEEDIRKGKNINLKNISLDDYWKDLIILLQIHSFFKQKDFASIEHCQQQLTSSIYQTYIDRRLSRKQQHNKQEYDKRNREVS